MASDLSGGPRTGLHAQLCGDAHLSNFGAFAAPDRRLVFSINDFDETLPGPFEWDVKRLVASFAVAGRDRDFDERQREAINLEVGRSYRATIAEFAGLVADVVGYSGRLVFDPSRPDGTPRKLLDVSRLSRLGWRAGTDLRTGLAAAYADFLAGGGRM